MVFIKISQFFTGKHLCQSLSFNKGVWHRCFPVKFDEISKKTIFKKHFWTSTSYYFRKKLHFRCLTRYWSYICRLWQRKWLVFVQVDNRSNALSSYSLHYQWASWGVKGIIPSSFWICFLSYYGEIIVLFNSM